MNASGNVLVKAEFESLGLAIFVKELANMGNTEDARTTTDILATHYVQVKLSCNFFGVCTDRLLTT